MTKYRDKDHQTTTRVMKLQQGSSLLNIKYVYLFYYIPSFLFSFSFVCAKKKKKVIFNCTKESSCQSNGFQIQRQYNRIRFFGVCIVYGINSCTKFNLNFIAYQKYSRPLDEFACKKHYLVPL